MAPTVRRAPYKDYLQPALQRRFTSTASVLVGVSYLEAVLLADWHSYLWSWFPIGPALVRTLVLFLCGATVLVLRISQYHVGLRTSDSPFEVFARSALRFQTLETLTCYVLSGLLFGLLYLWSAPDDANLRLITYYSVDRARLNERPLFLASHLFTTAVWASVSHLYNDVDRLELGSAKVGGGAGGLTGPQGAVALLMHRLPQVVVPAIWQVVYTVGASFVVYPLFQRQFVWSWTMAMLRPFYNLPKTNLLPPSWPFDFWTLCRCAYASFLVSIIWMSGNVVFSIFMVKEPLKNGKPLTSESKDPNGSLLNGLKSKKPPVQAFAMWELSFIARDFEARRRAIFEDIDRKDGPMWSQIYVICLGILKSVESRIDDYGKAPAPAPVVGQPAVETKPRVAAPLKEDPVFQKQPPSKSMRGEVGKAIGQIATSPGHSPVSQLSPLAKRTLRNARDKVLSKEQQEALSSGQLRGRLQGWVLAAMSVRPLGYNNILEAWFRRDFRRRFTAAVLGAPHAEPSLYANAATVLAQLAVHSLAEDKFGNVHRDVAAVVRAFTVLAKKLEAFKLAFPVHWTDRPDPSRTTPETDLLLEALRRGLAQVVDAFEPYAADLRLTRKDLRLAREAASLGPEIEPADERPPASEPEMEQAR